MDKELTLFDFSSSEALASLGPIDDRVMGGVSSSTFMQEEPSGALFPGVVSMEHGGDFAFARSEKIDLDLFEYFNHKSLPSITCARMPIKDDADFPPVVLD